MSLAPQADLSAQERDKGLRLLVVEAAFSSGTSALTSGVILTAFALHLGASNLWVGLLASAPFLTQLLQVPAILLVERLRARKRIAVLSSIAGRTMMLLMAGCSFFTGTLPLLIFLVGQYVLCGLSALGACAWNSWLRDLAPDERLGEVFARRTSWTAGISLLAGLMAAFLLQQTPPGSFARSIAFGLMFVAGFITGMISAGIVARMPEPLMPPGGARLTLGELLRSPFSDSNFRHLLIFVVSWQFAVNLATPFFTVFIVRQLAFNISLVMILSAVSQLANLLALRSWGLLGDLFSNKSVLQVSAPAYILSVMAMMGASQMENRLAIVIWLTLLHVSMGAAVAGVTLASTNIALKLSPKGSATAYVASNALATAVAAGVAPIAGGMLADVFARRRLELVMRWTGPKGTLIFGLHLSHWDFYFLLAGCLGLYAVHRLSMVAEEGEIERREMVGQVLIQTWRTVRNMSSVAGLRLPTDLPVDLLRDARLRFRLARARRKRATQATERS